MFLKNKIVFFFRETSQIYQLATPPGKQMFTHSNNISRSKFLRLIYPNTKKCGKFLTDCETGTAGPHGTRELSALPQQRGPKIRRRSSSLRRYQPLFPLVELNIMKSRSLIMNMNKEILRFSFYSYLKVRTLYLEPKCCSVLEHYISVIFEMFVCIKSSCLTIQLFYAYFWCLFLCRNWFLRLLVGYLHGDPYPQIL